MARWYDSVRLEDPETGPGDSGHLIGEVSHAAGNLVHRMYYWTGILEEQPEPGDTDEAVRELRDTLGGLHQLVKRTMDLLRPVKLHLINVAAGDLLRSLTMRLGVELDPAEMSAHESLLGEELRVDPVQVDRAVGLIAEAIGRHDPRGGGTSHTLRISSDGDDPASATICLESSGQVQTHGQGGNEAADRVHGDVGLALARKIFLALGWQADLFEQHSRQTLSVVIPIVQS